MKIIKRDQAQETFDLAKVSNAIRRAFLATGEKMPEKEISKSSLTSVNIPSSVTSIGEWAFGGCNSLMSITLRASEVIVHSDGMLAGTPALKRIYVPAHLVEEYKQAKGWRDFADKIKAIP